MSLIDYGAWAVYVAGVVIGLRLVSNCFTSPVISRYIWWVGLGFLLCPWPVSEGSAQYSPGVFLGLFDYFFVNRSVEALLWGLRAPALLALVACGYCLFMQRNWSREEQQSTTRRRRRR